MKMIAQAKMRAKADAGDAECQTILGIQLIDNQETFQDGLHYLKLAADQGKEMAQLWYAIGLSSKLSGPANPQKLHEVATTTNWLQIREVRQARRATAFL